MGRWAWKKRPCRPSGKRVNASGKTEEVEREWGDGHGKSNPVGHGTFFLFSFFGISLSGTWKRFIS